MKAYVITIQDHTASERAAERCQRSAEGFGTTVHKHKAYTPENKPLRVLKEWGFATKGIDEIWSRTDRAAAAFLSHLSLWQKCVETNEEILILEHDAVFMAPVPDVSFKGLLSLGQPSYGKYKTPSHLGVNPLTSKSYLPGAHAYIVNPWGAAEILERARTEIAPTDVFLRTDRFPWLQEYYPWPVKTIDRFTTIQNNNGIRAKHAKKEGYKIL